MRQRVGFAAGIGSAAVLAALFICSTRVPEGFIGLQMRGSWPVGFLSTGFHAKHPLETVAFLPSGPHEYDGILTTITKEGASLTRPFRLSLDFSTASPARLTTLGRALADRQSLDNAVALMVNEAAQSGANGSATPADDATLATALVPFGLVAGTLRLQTGSTVALPSGQTPGNPLRATFKPPAWPVLVIGIDAADWDLINPLIAVGALPNLKELRDRGAWGTLRSMTPMLSPILWTTAATGRPPEDHGIMDFLMKDPATGAEVPISRIFRRVKAVWNIVGDFDLPTLTVAWWATWPAEAVNGEMITDRVSYSLFDFPSGGDQPGVVYPASLLPEVQRLKIDPEEITYEELRAIIDIDQGQFERARLVLDSPQGYSDPVCHLIRVLASTQTYHAIAMKSLARRTPALSMVYYEGLDEVNHRFAQYAPPALRMTRDVAPHLVAAYAEAVSNFYRLQDRLIGELVAAAGSRAVVMILSDHGFANGSERPLDVSPDVEGKPGLWHTAEGILMVVGPPIRATHLSGQIGLLDIAPTLLALFGLPRAADMPGHALTDIFKPDAAPATPGIDVASYEQIGEPLQTLSAAGASPQDEEMIAKLTALGYIQSGGETQRGTGTATYHVNAGHIFLSKNQLDRAGEEFERARTIAPNFEQPLLGLAQVEMMRGRPAAAIPFMEQAIKVSAIAQPNLLTRAALIYQRAGAPGQGIEFLQTLQLTGRKEAYRLTAIGLLHLAVGQEDEALAAFLEALELDPSVGRALQGAYVILKKRQNQPELLRVLRRSLDVEAVTVAVRAANWLALVLEASGNQQDARSALLAAIGKAPDDVTTLTNLGSMLTREDRAAEGLPYLDRARARRPNSFEVQVNLIIAHGKLGHLDEAREIFAKAALPKERFELYNAIAYACFLNGANQDANMYINRSLALNHSQPDALRLKEEIDRKGRL